MDDSENDAIVCNMEDIVVGYNSLNCAVSLPVQAKSLFAESELEA